MPSSKREYDDAASRVRQLEAQARSAQAALDIARLNLSYTRVTAPISGRVGRAEVTAGNLVQGEAPNSPRAHDDRLVEPDLRGLRGRRERLSQVRERAARNASAPLPVQVGLADEDGFPARGRRSHFVDNRVDAQSGTVRMRAVLDNRDGSSRPGLFARVRLSNGTRTRRAVLVNDRAIGTDQSKRFVLVVDAENKAEYREVSSAALSTACA